MGGFSNILEELDDSIVIVQNGEIKYINDQVTNLMNLPKEKIIGKQFAPFIASEYREKVIERHKKRLEGKNPVGKYEIELLSNDNERIPVEINVSRIEYENNPATVTVIRDITERKKREKELKEYKTIVETAPDPIAIVDTKGNFKLVNKALCNLTGYKRDTLLGSNFSMVKTESEINETKKALKRLLSDEKTEVVLPEAKLETKNGDQIICQDHMAVISNEEEPNRIIIVHHDITKLKKREKELKEEQALTKSIFRSVPDLVYAFDTEGNFLRVSESNLEVTGYTRKEHQEMSPRDFFKGKDKKRAKKIIHKILNTGEPQNIEADLITKNGEKIPYEFTASRMESEDGEILGIAGIGRDITERKKREKELKREREFINQAINTIDDIFYVINTEGDIIRWNDQVNEITGYTDEEIEDMDAIDFFPKKEREKISECIKEAINTGHSNIEANILTKNGDCIPHHFTGSRLTGPNGEIIGDVGIARNITERKEHEKKLKRQNKHLEDFASLISHELRNPLNIAQVNLELLKNEEQTDKIQSSLERIEQIIDRLLVYTRTGRGVDEVGVLDVGEVSRRCWGDVILEDGCDLCIEDSLEVRADPSLFRHLLENLFKNAVENGASNVYIGRLDNGFYIADDGPGIPKDKRDKIFDVGYSDRGDTGLGLNLVEQVATSHNWNISVTESKQNGAKFKITGI